MKTKRIISLVLGLFLCLTVLLAVTPHTHAAGYFTESDVSNVECTILSNPAHAAYVNSMMRYHILSPDNNYRIGRNLENGASVVFFFDGCSDNVDDPVYGDYNNYHLSAYCAVVQKVGGVPKVVFESENCTTIPDNPRDAGLNENVAVPTLLDGIYNIVSTNHKGRYAALNISDYNYVAPVIRCDNTISYISSSDGINIHARRYFPGVQENGVSAETYNSTGCLNVGLIGSSWKEYNDFIYTVLGVSNAIVTTPDEDGEWTQCEQYLDKGVVVVDRSQYKTQLAAIYGDDNSHTATGLVSEITAYTDVLNASWSAPFKDISNTGWQYAAAEYALEKNLMAGKGTDAYGRIIFDPNSPITREEFVQVLYNAEGKPSVDFVKDFPDVAENGWYKNAVLWANKNNIASGLGDGSFGIGKNITRQDLALMLYKYAILKGYSLNAEAERIDRFADGSLVSGYAKEAMNWAVSKGVLSGKGTAGADVSTFRLDPAGTATRAECAAMLRNFMTAFDSTCSHSAMTKTEENAPTCSQQGYDLYQCADCGYTEKQNFTDPTGAHDYQLISDTATCTAAGIKTEACSACGDTKASPSAAKGHGATRTETKDATTDADGYTRVICTVCSSIVSETTLPKLEDTHNCADYMKRINCADLKDNALGWYTANYQTYYQCSILACEECGQADPASLEFIYTPEQATAKIVEMINAERYRVYGTHDYDVVVASHHSASTWAAEYVATDFQHCTPFWDNIHYSSPVGDIVRTSFNSWMNSPGHYGLLIDKDAKYVSLGVYIDDTGKMTSCLIMWHTDELYLDNPNYTWWAR